MKDQYTHNQYAKDQYTRNQQNGVIEIDLIKFIKALWQHALPIALAAVICAVATFAYTFFLIDPTYEANCEVYVNNSSINIGSTSLSISSSDLTASKSLVDTYIVILESRTTLNQVIEDAHLSYTYKELLGMISASSVNNTEVFNIKVTSTDPEEAKLIANTIAQVLPEKVAGIVDGSSVRIVDYAVKPAQKASPSITKNTAIGFILGFVIACGYVAVCEFFDDGIHDEDALADNFNLPVIGVIPDLDEEGTKDYYYYKKNQYKRHSYGYKKYYNYAKYGNQGKDSELAQKFISSQVELDTTPEEEKELNKRNQKMLFSNVSFSAAEAYKLLRTNVNFIASENACKMIGITSSTRGEGKSTTSLNLAYTLAESGKSVLLIDADLRIPTISKRMGIEQTDGLSSLLAGFKMPEEVITPSKIFKKWHIIPAGVVPPNPNELLAMKRTENVFRILAESYDYIIVDLPPINIVADALTIAGLLDAMVVVVRQDYSSKYEIKDALRSLSLINCKPIGFVLTDVADRNKGYKYSKYRRYSGYRYKKERYGNYGYDSYYEKKTYIDPRIYAMRAKKTKDNQ